MIVINEPTVLAIGGDSDKMAQNAACGADYADVDTARAQLQALLTDAFEAGKETSPATQNVVQEAPRPLVQDIVQMQPPTDKPETVFKMRTWEDIDIDGIRSPIDRFIHTCAPAPTSGGNPALFTAQLKNVIEYVIKQNITSITDAKMKDRSLDNGVDNSALNGAH